MGLFWLIFDFIDRDLKAQKKEAELERARRAKEESNSSYSSLKKYSSPTSNIWLSMSSKEIADHRKVLQQELSRIHGTGGAERVRYESRKFFAEEWRNSAPPADKLYKKY